MASKKSKVKLNILQRVALETLWVLCWLTSRLPHWVLYHLIAPTIRFIIYRIVGYRHSVVEQNLRESFPEKSEQERRIIMDEFYTILSEIVVSTIGQTNHKSNFDIFPQIDDPSEGGASQLYKTIGDNSWIALTAHLGLWEYFSIWRHYTNQQILAVYHPLENPIFDILFKRLRTAHKVTPIATSESVRCVMQNGKQYNGESYMLGLIADQNPPLLQNSTWFSFLGRETIFFEGGDKLARKVRLPVFFIYQRRIGRGRYDFRYHPIWDGEEAIAPSEITQRYIELLERVIREEPAMWLWSHKRWKVRRIEESDARQNKASQ